MSEIEYGYCHCGCGEKTNLAKKTSKRFGWVKDKPLKFIKLHGSRGIQLTPDYFVDKKTDCWIWQKYLDKNGYGAKRDFKKGKKVKAHRYYYEMYKGEIPKGLVIDHICRNSSCVNPDHLEVVTVAENTRRGKSTKYNKSIINMVRRLKHLKRKDISKIIKKIYKKDIGENYICNIINKNNLWS